MRRPGLQSCLLAHLRAFRVGPQLCLSSRQLPPTMMHRRQLQPQGPGGLSPSHPLLLPLHVQTQQALPGQLLSPAVNRVPPQTSVPQRALYQH